MINNLILYGASYSVYVRIARIVLLEKDLSFELEEIDIYSPESIPDTYADLHPFRRIPVLRHGDEVIYETNAITRYIDEVFPEPGLQPKHPLARARMNQLISIIDHYGYRPMIWGVYTLSKKMHDSKMKTQREDLAVAIQQAAHCLSVMSKFLHDRRYFVDDTLSLADLHIAPILTLLGRCPEGEQLLRQYNNIDTWLKFIALRPSMAETRFENEAVL